MSTNEPTPSTPPTAAGDTERHDDTSDAATNTVITLTVEEAQSRWDELIDRAITAQGPVHIASPTGGAGVVLMSIEDYEAVRVLMDQKPSKEATPSDIESGPDDAARH